MTPLYDERHVLIAADTLLAGKDDPIGWSAASQLPMCLLEPACAAGNWSTRRSPPRD